MKWYFDMLVYRLFYWRWNRRLQENRRLRLLFLNYLNSWEAMYNEPAMGIGQPSKYPEISKKVNRGGEMKTIAELKVQNYKDGEKIIMPLVKSGYCVNIEGREKKIAGYDGGYVSVAYYVIVREKEKNG